MSASIESRLRRIEALEQIRLLKAKYCDLCDDGYPADELASLFTDDGAWDAAEMGSMRAEMLCMAFLPVCRMSCHLRFITLPTPLLR